MRNVTEVRLWGHEHETEVIVEGADLVQVYIRGLARFEFTGAELWNYLKRPNIRREGVRVWGKDVVLVLFPEDILYLLNQLDGG